MKIKRNLIIVLFVLGIFGLFIFTKVKNSNGENKEFITASFYPMYFFASQIAGGKFNVVNIIPAGAEPHDYVLTPTDIVKIQKSKLVILNGDLEPWVNKISSRNILIVGQGLGVQDDPHVWLSPRLAKLEAEKIAIEIEKIDPINKEYYDNNLKKLESNLAKLDQEYKSSLGNCKLRTFVTSHAAFSYLAKDYNLKQIAIEGLSPDEEPSLAKLVGISNFVKRNGIKYVFFESLVSPKLSETIAAETGAKTLVLDPIEGVIETDLIKGVNYLTLMESNLQNLKLAMECR